jgi:hypothetical protein
VDDAAVVRAGFHPGAAMLFHDADRASRSSDATRRRQSGHTGTDHEDINGFIRHQRVRFPGSA